jgi:hypothetical protein
VKGNREREKVKGLERTRDANWLTDAPPQEKKKVGEKEEEKRMGQYGMFQFMGFTAIQARHRATADDQCDHFFFKCQSK